MVRAAVAPLVAPNAAWPVQNKTKMGLIGATIEAAGHRHPFHGNVRLSGLHAGQRHFAPGLNPFYSNLPIITNAQRESDGELLAFPSFEVSESGASDDFFKDSARHALEGLVSWGEIKSYSGLGNSPELLDPIRFVENGATSFITSPVYEVLSEPVFLVSRPNRGGMMRCALRAFVNGLTRGPRGEPSPLGRYRVSEFDGAHVQSTVFLRTFGELTQGQRDEVRYRLALHY